MYRLKAINESMCTRFVELENELTGTTNLCFDDSALLSDSNNFEFMKIGKKYDCKIMLFGKFVNNFGERVVEVFIVNKEVIVGNTEFIEVSVNGNIYYILKKQLKDNMNVEKLLFQVSRKDLIQVNDRVHPDLLD